MIAVIDYGMGNLRSVSKALESLGAKVIVTSDAKEIAKADGIVLPGVGAFQQAMNNLTKANILPTLLKSIEEGKPFLGICLGLQLLFTESEEHGLNKGLGILKGRVKSFGSDLKVPHMGWNQVKVKKSGLFKDIPDSSYFYFVHTYYVEPEDKGIVAGTTEYGVEFTSAVNKENIWGVQFHPEKSSALGLKFLENFCKYVK